jgi:hypothetical protein
VRPGRNGVARARITQEQLSLLVDDLATPISWLSNRVLDMPEGGLPDFLDWWLVLRSALDGRRAHARGDVSFAGPTRRTFTPDDSDEEMRAFLEDAGYLHIAGLFTEAEMAAVEAEFPRVARYYEKGDPKAWFATTKDGVEHLVRMEAFGRHSPLTMEFLRSERFQRIGGIPRAGHQHADPPDARVSALDKPIGVVTGISDVPWHKDCSFGRHSYECCGLTVGISVNGAGSQNGQLRVVPGSHRALVWPSPCLQPGLDLEPVDLPTRTGDVTVHLTCTLHMSQPPVERPRKVLYTDFVLPAADREALARGRRRFDAMRHKAHTSFSPDPAYFGD